MLGSSRYGEEGHTQDLGMHIRTFLNRAGPHEAPSQLLSILRLNPKGQDDPSRSHRQFPLWTRHVFVMPFLHRQGPERQTTTNPKLLKSTVTSYKPLQIRDIAIDPTGPPDPCRTFFPLERLFSTQGPSGS